MKLEVGKYYKTRNGDKVFLHETKEEGCAGFGEPHGLYLHDGKFGYMEKGRHHCACPDLDIIAEWTDTPEVGPVRTVTTTRFSAPSIEYLRGAVSYSPETGELLWRNRSDMSKSWNTKHAGKKAFNTKSDDGYCRGRLGEYFLSAHRVAWAIHYGEWPEDELDHIDRDPSNNRIDNLRVASPSKNQWNKDRPVNNTSGHKGVTFSKDKGKWMARISSHGRSKFLGYYDDVNDAANAYIEASLEHHGEFGNA